MTRARWRCEGYARAAYAAVVLGASLACSAPAVPTPVPGAVVHFESRVDSVLIVAVDSGDSHSTMVLTACGGTGSLDVAPPPASDPRVLMGATYDRSGALDATVETAEPADLGDIARRQWAGASVIWSTGEVGIDDLPRWITFYPGDVTVEASPPAEPGPEECEPWPTD